MLRLSIQPQDDLNDNVKVMSQVDEPADMIEKGSKCVDAAASAVETEHETEEVKMVLAQKDCKQLDQEKPMLVDPPIEKGGVAALAAPDVDVSSRELKEGRGSLSEPEGTQKDMEVQVVEKNEFSTNKSIFFL